MSKVTFNSSLHFHLGFLWKALDSLESSDSLQCGAGGAGRPFLRQGWGRPSTSSAGLPSPLAWGGPSSTSSTSSTDLHLVPHNLHQAAEVTAFLGSTVPAWGPAASWVVEMHHPAGSGGTAYSKASSPCWDSASRPGTAVFQPLYFRSVGSGYFFVGSL